MSATDRTAWHRRPMTKTSGLICFVITVPTMVIGTIIALMVGLNIRESRAIQMQHSADVDRAELYDRIDATLDELETRYPNGITPPTP